MKRMITIILSAFMLLSLLQACILPASATEDEKTAERLEELVSVGKNAEFLARFMYDYSSRIVRYSIDRQREGRKAVIYPSGRFSISSCSAPVALARIFVTSWLIVL